VRGLGRAAGSHRLSTDRPKSTQASKPGLNRWTFSRPEFTGTSMGRIGMRARLRAFGPGRLPDPCETFGGLRGDVRGLGSASGSHRFCTGKPRSTLASKLGLKRWTFSRPEFTRASMGQIGLRAFLKALAKRSFPRENFGGRRRDVRALGRAAGSHN
jgi:hypothetical protein